MRLYRLGFLYLCGLAGGVLAGILAGLIWNAPINWPLVLLFPLVSAAAVDLVLGD